MKQLQALIMGKSYVLCCPTGAGGNLLAAVERVDTVMCKIRDNSHEREHDRIAVLAALNLSLEKSDAAPFRNAPQPGHTPELEAKIMGKSYVLPCPTGSGSKVLAAIERVDTAIRKTISERKLRRIESIAVLTAVNIAFAELSSC